MNYPPISTDREIDDSYRLLLLLQSAICAHNEAAGKSPSNSDLRLLHRQVATKMNAFHAELFAMFTDLKEAEQADASTHARPRT